MGPLAVSDGPDPAGFGDELVPGVAALIDDIARGLEDAVGEPVVAHILPDVLDRVELGTFGGDGNECDVSGHIELTSEVPPRLIDQQHRVRTRCNQERDFGEMEAHHCGIAEGKDEACSFIMLRTDCTEDVH